MTLDDVAGELYGLDPGVFVATRTERAAAARAEGDRALAEAITALRKPTVAAWTVNLLARHAPTEIAALLDLGAALRSAQRQLSGDKLRALGNQRQQVVNAMTKRAGELAAEHDRPASEQVLREVGQTLTAALADPEVADRVRAGVLPTALTYDGFGPAGLVAITGGKASGSATRARRRAGPSQEDALATRRAEAQQELADAESALDAARSTREEAESAARQAKSDLDEVESRIAELRDALEHAEQQRHFARTAEHRARGESTAARSQFDRMQRWVDRARARLDED
ncbi:hypothetical protein BOX37_03030 [Nocardia mangyaensis]|uniref:Uncharacterized protein n=1 Tax=Nocardia mangyaensis TaxID=2213200 RepID=A0A1J0VM51_9NOCA|nr:hypothetical protein [Nocardia mangyaensis]APE33108.1 hypothetical protein BOX37_03030 [Nocardia mangyaensis]